MTSNEDKYKDKVTEGQNEVPATTHEKQIYRRSCDRNNQSSRATDFVGDTA